MATPATSQTMTLPIRHTMHKARSAGGPVFAYQLGAKLCHRIFYFSQSFRGLNYTVLIGQISFIQQFVMPMSQPYKALNQRVGTERLTDIVDLTSFVTAIRVFEESNLAESDGTGRHIEQLSVRCSDNGVKLGFNHDTWPLPDSPAEHLFAAYSLQCLWHDVETFIFFCTRQGFMGDMNGLSPRNDLLAEG